MKHAALLRGEYRPDLALDLGQRGAELVDVAGQQSGQERRQQQPGHAGLGSVRSASRPKKRSSASPESPSTPSGSASTHRHRSGIGWRATSGLTEPVSGTPASITSPGAENVQTPTLERAARPLAYARRSGPAAMPASAASPRAIASPSLVPEPSPICGGIASWTSTSTPAPIPNRDHARRANVVARSACDPVTTTASPAEASR